MSITAICAACGRKYTVGDSMAGKRARCKDCGGLIEVPAPATVGATPQSAPADQGRSRPRVEPPPLPASRPVAAPAGQWGTPAWNPAYTRPVPVAAIDATVHLPYEDVIDQWGPYAAMVLLLLGVVAAAANPRQFVGNPMMPVWVPTVLALIQVALVMGALAPLVMLGVFICAKIMPFDMPRRSYLRSCAVVCVPWAIVLFAQALSASSGWTILAIALAFVAWVGMLWVMFRLKPLGFLVCFAFEFIFMAVGAAVVGGITAGIAFAAGGVIFPPPTRVLVSKPVAPRPAPVAGVPEPSLGPGFSLEIKLDRPVGDESERRRAIATQLRDRLAQRGLVGRMDAPTRVTASIRRIGSEQIDTSGGGDALQTIDADRLLVELVFADANGNSFFRQSRPVMPSESGPGSFTLQPGQSAAEAYNARIWDRATWVFAGIPLPSVLPGSTAVPVRGRPIGPPILPPDPIPPVTRGPVPNLPPGVPGPGASVRPGRGLPEPIALLPGIELELRVSTMRGEGDVDALRKQFGQRMTDVLKKRGIKGSDAQKVRVTVSAMGRASMGRLNLMVVTRTDKGMGRVQNKIITPRDAGLAMDVARGQLSKEEQEQLWGAAADAAADIVANSPEFNGIFSR